MGLDLTSAPVMASACVSDLFLYSPCVFFLCVAINNDGKRRSFTTSKSLFLSFSLSGFQFFPTLLYVFLLLSSILFGTLDEVQLCIGHAFLNPGMELQPPLFPSLFPFLPCFSTCLSPVFLSANEAAPHSLSSERDCYTGLDVCLMLMSLLFEIHPFISAFTRMPPVLLNMFVCCLSSRSLLML